MKRIIMALALLVALALPATALASGYRLPDGSVRVVSRSLTQSGSTNVTCKFYNSHYMVACIGRLQMGWHYYTEVTRPTRCAMHMVWWRVQYGRVARTPFAKRTDWHVWC